MWEKCATAYRIWACARSRLAALTHSTISRRPSSSSWSKCHVAWANSEIWLKRLYAAPVGVVSLSPVSHLTIIWTIRRVPYQVYWLICPWASHVYLKHVFYNFKMPSQAPAQAFLWKATIILISMARHQTKWLTLNKPTNDHIVNVSHGIWLK